METPESNLAEAAVAGLYGKLPGLGDFVTRRLPSQFVHSWDRWLRECMAASQSSLGGDWLSVYLTSPLWRFALTPGIAGQSGWIGVLMPSVDRVGRYFPLTLARQLPDGANCVAAVNAGDWFEAAEAIVLATLDDGFRVQDLDQRLLALPGLDLGVPATATGTPGQASGDAWQLDLPSSGRPGDAYPLLLARALQDLYLAYSLWWTTGSERVAPSLLCCQGLPPPEGYAAMLAGRWADQGWARLPGAS
jgi:type VI secretion system protein ImpM